MTTLRKRATRDSQAKLLAAFGSARLDVEAEEERRRTLTASQAAAAGFEIALQCYQQRVAPRTRRMLPRHAFDELRPASQAAARRDAARHVEQQREQRALEQQALALQAELRGLRREFRALAQAVGAHCRKEQSAVLCALGECVASVDASIAAHRADCAESPHLLNRALESSRIAHRDFLHRALTVAASITTTYGKLTFAHTRIPVRIRDRLRHASTEDLLLLFDTLSFEDGALQFMLSRYPPGPDDGGEMNPLEL